MSNNILKVERTIIAPHYANPAGGAPVPIAIPIMEFSCLALAGTSLPALRAVRVLPSFLDDPDYPDTIILSSLDIFVLLPDPISTFGASIMLGSLANFAAADLAARIAILWNDVELILESTIRNPVADYSWTFRNYDTITP